jgi:hypothetical protein
MERHGKARSRYRYGKARKEMQGMARQGKNGKARHNMASQGKAWHGNARKGMAWNGNSRKEGKARIDMEKSHMTTPTNNR